MSPSRRTIALLFAWLGLAFAAAFWPVLVPVWLGGGVLLFVALGVDALMLWSAPAIEVERDVSHSLSVGVWSDVKLRLHNAGKRRLSLTVLDHPPSDADVRDLPRRVRLAPGEHADLAYGLFPIERGRKLFAPADLVVDSPLGLWRSRRRAGEPSEVRVYPNFRAIMRYDLLATDNRTRALGIRRRPRRGEGLDFHQLREYRAGDALRQIDWKATMRLGKAISREYQDERDQQIVFLLDCGRKMHARDDELSHFDHALNALLLLSHVALRQGDAVGLLTFSGEHRWLAPRKGAGHLNAILNTVFDLQTGHRASDYMGAAQELSKRVSKRALVVVVSNLRDEDHEELLLASRLLGRTHLVLLASMQEEVLQRTLAEPVRDFEGALRTAATHQYLRQRKRAHGHLKASGVLCLDVEPGQLPVALVNGYLDVKSSGVL